MSLIIRHTMTRIPLVLVAFVAFGFQGCADDGMSSHTVASFVPRGFVACGTETRGIFCDASAQWGIGGEVVTSSKEGASGRVTSADFNGDGRYDLLVSYDTDRAPSLWLRTAEGFVERGEAWGLASFHRVIATAAADFDGDGDPDLLLSAREAPSIQLLRNTGATFEAAVQLAARGEFTALVPVDFDGDGWLDVTASAEAVPGECGKPFISGCPGGVRAWRRVDPWRFEPVPVEASPRRALAIRWHDLDDDGHDELMVVADFGMLNGGNQVLRVERRPDRSLLLKEVAPPPGFDVRIFGMGVAPIDVDRDGHPELLVTNFGRNVLLRRRHDRWEDVALAYGVDVYGITPVGEPIRWNAFDPAHRWMGPLDAFERRYLDRSSPLLPMTWWTPIVFDYDHDGFDDVYLGAASVGLGVLFPEARLQSGAMLRGTGRRLHNVTNTVRLGERHGAAFPAAVDLDGDGDLDLALPRSAFPERPGSLALLRNDASGGNALWIEARGRGGARDGIGARVRVFVGGYTTTRRLDGNLSIAGSGPHGVHVGLGRHTHADLVEVRFVSGVTRRLLRVPAGRVTVEE